MKTKEFFYWILTILFIFMFQIIFSDKIALFGAFPNLLLLGTIFFAVQAGPIEGEITGFLCGLLSDASSIFLFGSQTFMLTLIGYITGRLQRKINEEKLITQVVVVFLMSLLYVLGLLCFEMFFEGSIQRFKVTTSVVQPLYSTLISPIFFYILIYFNQKAHYGIRK